MDGLNYEALLLLWEDKEMIADGRMRQQSAMSGTYSTNMEGADHWLYSTNQNIKSRIISENGSSDY